MNQKDINKNTGYHDIYCIECGNKFKANEITLNMDEIFRINSDYIRKSKNNNDYDVFKIIKLGMNYSKEQIEMLFENKKIETKDIRKFLSQNYNLNITVEKEIKDEEPEIVIQTTARRKINSNSSRNNKQTHTNIPNDILEKYEAIVKFRVVDIDKNIKNSCYEKLHRILTKDEVILEIKEFDLFEKKDDRGNTFLNKVKYTLSDGKLNLVNDLNCPHCGAEIKGNLGKHKQFVIGMIGTARVGKTAYLASLVERLSPKNGNMIDDNIFVEIGDSSIGREMFEKQILKTYIKGAAIDKTSPSSGWVPVFCLEVEINKVKYIFTFVDMPGEVFCIDNIEEKDLYRDLILNTKTIITNANILWFCIDPAQFDEVIVNSEKNTESESKKEDNVILDISKIIKGIKDTLEVIDINDKKNPAAILITKSDKIDPSFDLIEKRGQDERLTKSENGKSVFLIEEHKKHVEKVNRYLEDRNKVLIHDFNTLFDKKYNLFSVASYGFELHHYENQGILKPSNVEHPFLWTCAVLGLLPCKVNKKERIRVQQEVKNKKFKWPFCKSKEEVEVIEKEEIVEVVKLGEDELFFHKE